MENTPIFVKINEYKDIIGVVDEINEKIDGIRTLLSELRDIKQNEDEQIKNWNSQLDLVTEKMNYINGTLREM